jgi:hypothetical protein
MSLVLSAFMFVSLNVSKIYSPKTFILAQRVNILWPIDALLSGDCVTATVSEKRLGKHVPAATNTHATIEERCLLCGPCRYVMTRIVGAMSSVVSSISQRALA